MPRRPSLQLKATRKPHVPWLLELPPSLSSTGRRERRYFQTKRAGEEFARQQKIRFENFGTTSATLPAGRTEEAAAAFERLKPFGVSLSSVVEDWIASRKAAN